MGLLSEHVDKRFVCDMWHARDLEFAKFLSLVELNLTWLSYCNWCCLQVGVG